MPLPNNLQSDGKSDITYVANDQSGKTKPILLKLKNAYFLLWKDFLRAYTNIHVAKWSLWWAFATCGYVQVASYIQLIWESAVEGKDVQIYNGAVEALYTIIGKTTDFIFD